MTNLSLFVLAFNQGVYNPVGWGTAVSRDSLTVGGGCAKVSNHQLSSIFRE